MFKPSYILCPFLVLVAIGCIGCGTNKFQQELATEEAAMKLYRETVAEKYELIGTEDVKKLIDDKEEMILLDAMPTATSFDKGHLEGAVNFEFPKEIMKEWTAETMGDRTREQYEKLLGDDKGKLIVVYCGYVKCARSHNAAKFAKELGYTNVKRYPGGIHAWRGAGHALTK